MHSRGLGMKSNFRPLGDFIQLVDNRNKDGSVDRLLGINITKNFRWISLNDSANTKIYTNKSLSDEKIREGYRKQRIIERIRPVI